MNPEADEGGMYASCYMCLRVYPRPDGSPILWAMAEEIGEEDGVSAIYIYFNQSHQYGKVYMANEQQVPTSNKCQRATSADRATCANRATKGHHIWLDTSRDIMD